MDGELDGFPPRRRWPWVLLVVLVAFVGGAALCGWLAVRSPRVQALLRLEPVAAAQQQVAVVRAQALRHQAQPPAATPGATAADPALAGQVAALAEKVDDIELQARAATGDASRAEGLLVAFAARRALDRGVQLGYIEGLLRERFGHAQPDAVAAVLSAARQPVTLADLQTGLDAVAPALSAGGDTARIGWWDAIHRELAGLVVVRRADQPSTLPADRVQRAQRLVEGGQVDGALAEILRLPDRRAATSWIAAARRYLAGRGALDRIETAALLEPPPPLPATTADAPPEPAASAPAPRPTPAPVD